MDWAGCEQLGYSVMDRGLFSGCPWQKNVFEIGGWGKEAFFFPAAHSDWAQDWARMCRSVSEGGCPLMGEGSVTRRFPRSKLGGWAELSLQIS